MAIKKRGEGKDMHNREVGLAGERKAQTYLRLHGWKILEKNFKNPFGEIDIIARKKDVIAFIEVKTRLSDIFGLPSEAVDERRKRKYMLGANYYLTNKNIDICVRFDIIEIFKGEINHIENAFY